MAESSLANPLDLAAEWTARYGDAIANNDNITSLLRDTLAVRSGANGTLHFKLPSTPMTLRCDAIDFGALNVSKFACLENGAAITIQHTGVNDSYYLWYWNTKPVYEFVIGTTTAKASRDDYLITFVGTWTPANNGADGNGYNKNPHLIYVYASGVLATGPLIFRCHTKKPRGRGGFYWRELSTSGYAYPNATFYLGGTHHGGFYFGYSKANYQCENVLFTDPYCRTAGWRGATVATTSGERTYLPTVLEKGVTARLYGEFDSQFNNTLWVGKMLGRMELAYGHPNAEFSFTGTTNLRRTQVGNSIEDPFETVLTDVGYSGPECEEWGWEAGVLMGDVFFNSQPWKFDGFGSNEAAYPSFWKQTNGNNQYGRSISHFENIGDGDYAQWCGMECGGDGAYGRIASYITFILSDIAGHLRYNCGQQTGYAEYIHHLTYRGDGVKPAMVGGSTTPVRNSKLHLSIYDTLEYAQVFDAFIDQTGGDSETPTLTSYRRGCYNTIRDCTFTGKLTVQAGDGGGTGNTATNLKFIGTAREVIRVESGGQLAITGIEAPTSSTINVLSGGVCTVNGVTRTGVYTIQTSDKRATITDIPVLPGTTTSLSNPITLEAAYQLANSGAVLTNGASITSAINYVRDTYYPTCHILMPNQNWTFYCDPINFSTGNVVTKFALLESPTHKTTIRQTGTAYALFTFGQIQEIVIGSQTKKSSRDNYNLTLVGTWSLTNRGGTDSSGLIASYTTPTATASGPFIFRFNAKNARGTVFKYAPPSYNNQTIVPPNIYPAVTAYFSGRWENCYGISLNNLTISLVFEDLYMTDSCGRQQGWNGDSPATFDTAKSEQRSNFGYFKQVVGRVSGSVEVRYGWPTFCGGGFLDVYSTNYYEGNSWDDPLVIKYGNNPYSGPNDFGLPENVFLNGYGAYFYPQFTKYDGLPKQADGRYRKFINLSYGTPYVYYSWSTDLLIFQEANKVDELGSPTTYCVPDNGSPTSDLCGRQVAYLKHILVNVQGRVNLNGAGYDERTAAPYTYIKNAIHHIGVRGDGVNPAMVGHATTRPGVNTNWELSIWDTAEYAKLHNLDITPYGAPNTSLYVPGSNNSILNCTFTGKVRVLSNPFTTATTNTMTNVKFTNELYTTNPREIINVAAGTNLTISNIDAPSNCYITCNGTVRVNGVLKTGT